MKTIFWLALALCLGLAGCTSGYSYQPTPYGYYGPAPSGYYEPPPRPYQGPSVPGPWLYNYDPTMRQWYEMPYYNPYQQ